MSDIVERLREHIAMNYTTDARNDIVEAADEIERLRADTRIKFFDKYALGPLMRPSCLVCGTVPEQWPPAIEHAELPGIVVCHTCRDRAAVNVDPQRAELAERKCVVTGCGMYDGGEMRRLRAELASERAVAETKIHGLHIGSDGLYAGVSGGAAAILAETLADQYRQSGAINYLELRFESREDGERFIVTIQRAAAKTAHELRVDAEAERDALKALLLDSRVIVHAYLRGWPGSDVGELLDRIDAALKEQER